LSKLKGEVAVVTGGSNGIGAGIAKALTAEGASVVLDYASSKSGADKVVAAIIAAGGKGVAEGTHTAGFHGTDFETGVVEKTPLGRIGQPEDIACIAVFLASDDSAWLTSERVLAGGGLC
jgi:NAD(P)-dependent dehydrogenase (short-subunit alcohol dehydrogenase family)